MLLNSKRKS